MGFKVEKDIYKNGLNTETTGPAAYIATGGKADKIKTSLKVETKDGDFGAQGAGSGYQGKVKVGGAGFTVDSKGVSANADIGPTVASSITRVMGPDDVEDMIKEMFAHILTVQHGDKVVDLINHITGQSPEQLFGKMLDATFAHYFGGGLDEICEKLLDSMGNHVGIHMSLTAGATVGVSAALLVGQVQESEYKDEKFPFKIFKAEGKFAIEGFSGAYGLLHTGKGMDGYDQQVSFSSGVSLHGANVGATIYIGFNAGGPANDIINTMKKMF